MRYTHPHVRLAANVHCLGHGVDQLPTDAVIADLDVANLVYEDIGWLDVTMHDIQLGFEVV